MASFHWIFWVAFILLSTPSTSTGKRLRCGKRSLDENRIVDGREAVRGSHPWLVSLEYYNGERKKWEHQCGGTIIKKKWVVTAAHCFIDFDAWPYRMDVNGTKWRVVGGDHDKSVHENSEQILNVGTIILHDDFDLASEYNSPGDLALIKVVGSLRTNTPYSKQACRPGPNDRFPAHTHCEVAGWGAVQGRSLTKGSDDRLQYYNSTIVPMADCNRTAEEQGRRVLDNMICLKTEFDKKQDRGTGGVCRGDSGGALMCRRGERYYIAGIVSWSISHSCGQTHDVFTRYQSYAQWVTETIRFDESLNKKKKKL